MRLVILSANGVRQHYFINRLAEHHEIAGVVIDHRYEPSDRLKRLWRASDRRPLRMLRNVWLKARLLSDEREAQALEERPYYNNGTPPDLSAFDVHTSENINSEETVAHVSALQPDVVVVFGTRLLKEPLMRIAPKGTVNIHTGLSPYYRGGHCTFFCLYNDEPEYIGVTIHYIDPGIDSGELLLTGRPNLERGDTEASIESKLVLMGTDMMLEALRRIERDEATPVKQWTDGKLFYSRDFTLDKRIQLKRRMPRGLSDDHLQRVQDAEEDVRVIS